MKIPLLIYGAGGLGREVLSLVKCLDSHEPIGFIDDRAQQGTVVKDIKVPGGSEVLQSFGNTVHLVIAVGDPVAKASLRKKINSPYVIFPTLIHPSAILQDRASIHIGAGSIIAAGCILTSDITVGEHVLINLNTTVGHDTTIGHYTSIMPGVNIAGEVTIGESVLIGSGASLLNHIQVGNRSKVGMGAVVIHAIAPDVTAVGVPAKSIHKK